MAGKPGKGGQPGRSGAPGVSKPAGPGRLPQSATIRLGQTVAVVESIVIDGERRASPLAEGTVAEIRRGDPRAVVIEMADGRRVSLYI
jgi:hypothetical protein